MQPTTLDPDVVNLAKAIRENESGNNPTLPGKSGEYGAYQYTPEKWAKDAAAAGVNVPLKDATPEQQNEVAYKSIAAMKAQGLNIGEIASVWNSGKKDAYLDPTYKGTNAHGASYDVPAYAKAVADTYHKLKGQVAGDHTTNMMAPPVDPSGSTHDGSTNMMAPPVLPPSVATGDLASTPEVPADNPFSSPGENIAKGNQAANIDQSKGAIKGLLQSVRDVGGIDNPNPILKDQLAHAPKLQEALDAEKSMIHSKTHLGGNINQIQGYGMSRAMAALMPVSDGAKAVGVTKGLIGDALTGTKDAVVDAVSPRLTEKVAAETPTAMKGLLNKITPIASSRITKVADAVRPYFKTGATWTENATNANNAIASEAQALEQSIDKVDHPIVVKELSSRLRNVTAPISVKGTSFEKQITPLKNAAIDLTRQAGGTVKGTFLALRKFDDLVDKTWPTLWDRENAPMRGAVTAIRDEWKKFIEENLPADAIYRDSLEKQSLLYDARDTFREKAALGELTKQGEVGTNAVDRFATNHPTWTGLIKKGAGVAGLGAAGGAGLGAYQGFFGQK